MTPNLDTQPPRRSRLTPLCPPPIEAGDSIPEVPSQLPFPVEHLPIEAQAMISEVSRVSFAPPNLVAVQSLGWLAAALGKGAVSVSGAMQTFGNLFLLGIAETGAGKSESGRHLGKQFNDLLKEECRAWRADVEPKATARLKEIRLAVKALEKQIKGDQLTFPEAQGRELASLLREGKVLEQRLKEPRFIVEDATVEALADAMTSHDQSLISYSTDAGKLIANLHGRYSQSTEKGLLREDTLLLKSFSVEAVVVDRVGRSIVLEEPCLTMLWMVQPGKIPLLFQDHALCDGGFMPRVMPCLCPGGLPERSFQPPIDDDIRRSWERLVTRLFTFRKSGGAVQSPSRIQFQVCKDAAEVWLAWDNDNRRETRAGALGDVSAFVSRWGEWAQRIAVNLEACRFVGGANDRTISRETMEAAIAIAKWFANEQLRILHQSRLAARETELKRLEERAAKLESVLKESGKEKSLADLGRRNNFSPDQIRELAARFPERFEVRDQPSSTKPATVCVLK
jgi:hypothetical protein